jgi:RNA polymerase sigma factor (sigma-70 family)
VARSWRPASAPCKLRSVDESGGSDSPRQASFEEFFAAQWDRLFRTLVLVTGSSDEGEELAQDTMVRAFERWERVRRADSPAAYLYQIAFNLQRSRLRRLRRTLRAGLEIPGRSVDPEGVVAAREEVLALLRSVPLSQRQALVLVEWEDMSAQEAGRILGIDAASVRGRIHRARQTLQRRREATGE